MDEENKTPQSGQPAQQQPAQTSTGSAPAFDYEKLANILAGRTAATEDSVLKGYFKDHGITGEEAAQAIAEFKAQKAAKTPDAAALQAQVTQAQAAALEAQMTNRAMVMADDMGLDIKTIPYVMRLADLSAVVQDGEVSDDKLKEAIGKVLEDLPQLKKQAEGAGSGFRVGAGTGSTGGVTDEDAIRAAFGVKAK